MDTMLQMQIMSIKGRDLYVPTSIGRIVIDQKAHFYAVQNADPNNPGLYSKTHYFLLRNSKLFQNSHFLRIYLVAFVVGRTRRSWRRRHRTFQPKPVTGF